MNLRIPKSLCTKAGQVPESRHGACTVTLILASGKTVPDVVLAWGEEIVKIGDVAVKSEYDLPFKVSEVVDLY